MVASSLKQDPIRCQLVSILVFASLLTHLMGSVVSGASSSGSSGGTNSAEATSSSQPLWSYQVKPNSYGNLVGNGAGSNVGGVGVGGPSAHYTGGPSLFDAFTGLSQRQGALSGSPLMTILPIILIAAGGLLLLLPMFTMMLASPFGAAGGFSPFGGAAGGYQNFGYPQMAARKRSLDPMGAGSSSPFGQRAMIDLIEHVSSTIEELSKKYNNSNHQVQAQAGNANSTNKRAAKSMNSQQVNESPQANNQQQQQPANHKPLEEPILVASGTGNNNL